MFDALPAGLVHQVDRKALSFLISMVKAHRFDVLGSGWREWGVAEAAEVNAANRSESGRLRDLMDPGYRCIDWQGDAKSGHRWSPASPSVTIRAGSPAGADVKVPWELARMYHLPLLALGESIGVDRLPAGALCREFRNQVLDFVSANPPRFGVNWMLSMEVGIRAANLLLAYDLFRGLGFEFDKEFDHVFRRTIVEHGEHIRKNLEWGEIFRGNHYLANLCGLAFCGAFLAPSKPGDRWLRYARRHLREEVLSQFDESGAHHEGSTGYHCFSAQMALYSFAAIAGTERGHGEAFSELWRPVLKRLLSAVEFTRVLTKRSGRVPQIGDLDGGRLFKLDLPWRLTTEGAAKATFEGFDHLSDGADTEWWVEEQRDHRHLSRSAAGLTSSVEDSGDTGLEGWVVQQLRGPGHEVEDPPRGEAAPEAYPGRPEEADAAIRRLAGLGPDRSREYRFGLDGGGALSGLASHAYPRFGVFAIRSDRVYACLRCGPVGQTDRGGHSHNDQLALELALDGTDVIVDPGSYVYTADPRTRNAYRSVRAHFCPRVGGREPASLDDGLFFLGGAVPGRCLRFGGGEFLGEYSGFGAPVYRWLRLEDDQVVVTDFTTGDLPLEPVSEVGQPFLCGVGLPASIGYGLRWRERGPRGTSARTWIG